MDRFFNEEEFLKDETQYTEIDGVQVIQDEGEMVEAIRNGVSFAHWERGDSMQPIFKDGEYCIVDPIGDREVHQGDAIFCRVHGTDYYQTHIAWMVNNATKEVLLGTTSGGLIGWTNDVIGIARRTSNRVNNLD